MNRVIYRYRWKKNECNRDILFDIWEEDDLKHDKIFRNLYRINVSGVYTIVSGLRQINMLWVLYASESVAFSYLICI